MNDLVIPVLTEVIQKYGNSLLSDTRRLKALLSDLAGNYKLEINVLVQAADCRISQKLAQQANPTLDTITYSNLVRQLVGETGLTDEAAHWAVRAWSTALSKQLPPSTPPKMPSKGAVNLSSSVRSHEQANSDTLDFLEQAQNIQRNIQAAEVLLEQGLAYARLNSHDNAISFFDQALALNPVSAEALRGRGWSRYSKGDLVGAQSDLDQAIRLDPNDAAAYNNRGFVRAAKGDHDGAIGDYTEAIRLDPKFAAAYFNRGNARYVKDDNDGAINDYTEAIRLDPKYSMAYNNRGLVREAKGDKDGAISDYTKAIRLDPNNAAAYLNRGDARAAIGDHDGAISDFTEAIRLNPKRAAAYFYRGNARYDKGDKDGAISDYTEAIRLVPSNAATYNNRGNARSAKGDQDGAISDFTEAIRLDPNDAKAYFSRGFVRDAKFLRASFYGPRSYAFRGQTPDPVVVSPPVRLVTPAPAKPTKPRSIDLLPAPFAWIEIPGGRGTMKTDESSVTLTIPTERYWIAKYPLTNAQYRPFVEAGGYTDDRLWTADGLEARRQGIEWNYTNSKWEKTATGKAWIAPRYWDDPKWNQAECPVVGVSWFEAVAYCQWLSEATGEKIMLPTEEQWQYAAQGSDGRDYPWGKSWDASRCNNNVDFKGNCKITPVRQYEGKGDSPFKVVDMAGNVWEWCLTDYENRTNDVNVSANKKMLRGSSWGNLSAGNFRCDYRLGYDPGDVSNGWGFRPAIS